MRMSLMNQSWNKVFRSILKEKSIALLTHIHPDGDAYGSLLGIWHLLKSCGIDATAFIDESKKDGKFSFLPGYDELVTIPRNSSLHFDIAITLDCGDQNRISGKEWVFNHAKRVINIDHHISNPFFGHDNIVADNISSTCELIWILAKSQELMISDKTATCLITGIMTDTGNFLYENTSSETYRAAGDLVDKGAKIELIKFHLYHNKPLGNILFLGFLIQNMRVLLEGKVIYLTITNSLLTQHGVSYEDLDEYVAFARDIQGVEVAVLFKEMKDGNIKISLRSKSYFDVSILAQELNGGGHIRAAGTVSTEGIEKTKERITNLLEIYFQEKYNNEWNS